MNEKGYRLPYSPSQSREWLEKYFKQNYNTLSYNRFFWWRSYAPKFKELPNNHLVRNRIRNGDFDFPHYWFEAQLVEHHINERYLEIGIKDSEKFHEDTTMDRVRRKRLLEDFEKEEERKLRDLKKAILREIKMTEQEYDHESEFGPVMELADFYDYLVEKYGTYWKPANIPKFK